MNLQRLIVSFILKSKLQKHFIHNSKYNLQIFQLIDVPGVDSEIPEKSVHVTFRINFLNISNSFFLLLSTIFDCNK